MSTIETMSTARTKANSQVEKMFRAGRGWIAVLWGLVAICVSTTAAGQVYAAEDGWSPGRAYVILTDLPQGDPYYAAVRRLQEHRGAQIFPFVGENLGDALESIRRLSPQFVAIVVRPSRIDINFAYDVLEFSTKVDVDPFPDFAYGFITGATADDALGFVNNIIRAEQEEGQFPRKIFAFGPSDISQVDDGSKFDWARKWDRVRLAHKPGNFPEGRLVDLASSGVIRLWGHGSPDAVDEGLSSQDIQNLDFFPAVVFAGPCYSAVTGRSFEQDRCANEIKIQQIAPERSLALTFISRGISGYFGALAEDLCLSAGQEMEYALTTGLPLGMTAKYTYDGAIMSGGGKPVSLARFRPGKPPTRIDAAGTSFRLAASRVLLGDPAYQPFSKAADPPWAATLQQTAEGLDVVTTLDDPGIRCMLVDPFRADLCDCGSRNDRLYLVVELPPDFGGVKRVSNSGSAGDLAKTKHGKVQWVEERWLGRRLLHLQMDFRHGSLGRGVKGCKVVFHVQEARSGSTGAPGASNYQGEEPVTHAGQ